MSARTSRRGLAVLLVALAVLTLAPRTSDHLENGWSVVVVSDTSARAKGPVSKLTFWAMPPSPVPAVSRIPVYTSAEDWTLVAGPSNCTQETDAVVCVFNRESVRRKHYVSLTIRSEEPVSYSFSPPGPTVP